MFFAESIVNNLNFESILNKKTRILSKIVKGDNQGIECFTSAEEYLKFYKNNLSFSDDSSNFYECYLLLVLILVIDELDLTPEKRAPI